MSKRRLNTYVSLLALFFGLVLYVVFRPKTYVARLFDEIAFVMELRVLAMPFSFELFRFYLPDYLWGLSFGCALTALFEPRGGEIVAYSAVAAVFGTVWELCQWFGAVDGTGDALDVIMYLIAGLTVFYINKEKEK